MGRRVACLVAALVVVAPSSAMAATAASVYQRSFPGTPAFLYTAAAGEANRVTLTTALPAPGVVLVREDGPGVPLATDTCAPVLVGAVCTSLVHRDAAAGLPGTAPLGWGYSRVELRDGNDTLTVRGLGLSGGMDVFTGDGNDTVDIANGTREFVHCGPGSDRVRADQRDVVDSSCESVSR